uniref:G_PROTEIN_RECEP_F1_2 domain-containing protein n=1 Tax=Dracunculus medinensis TaxID=318479 RepID=A0A0N4UFX6_DRAME
LGSTITNAIIIIAIIRSKYLRSRREIMVMFAVSVADFVEAFATLHGGIYRTIIVLSDSIDTNFTPLQCMALPHSWLWRWSDFATAFSLLALSVDRLLSILVPVKYSTWGSNYIAIAIGVPYITSFILMLCVWITPITSEGSLSILCANVYLSPVFYSFSKYISSAASFLSILLYVPIIFMVQKQMKRMADKICVSQIDLQRKAQFKMTVTVAFSSCATFFLDVIPRAIGIFGLRRDYNKLPSQCESNSMMLFHLSKINSMINLLLFYRRNSAIRESIRRLFHLPGQLLLFKILFALSAR